MNLKLATPSFNSGERADEFGENLAEHHDWREQDPKGSDYETPIFPPTKT